MITREFDMSSYQNIPSVRKEVDDLNAGGATIRPVPTHLCHVLSDSANDGLDWLEKLCVVSVRS